MLKRITLICCCVLFFVGLWFIPDVPEDSMVENPAWLSEANRIVADVNESGNNWALAVMLGIPAVFIGLGLAKIGD